jgi:DNA invertase Pin-like site-specific DNA recombinase
MIGSQIQNIRDMDERGRRADGDRSDLAKLTISQVEEIRASFINGSREFGIRALARKYGVARPTIKDVLLRNTWKSV